MAKLDNMTADELRSAIDDVDKEIGEQGAAIQKARTAQRKHLEKKDTLVLALNDRLRAEGGAAQTLGDDRA
jgi:hypothetical protein